MSPIRLITVSGIEVEFPDPVIHVRVISFISVGTLRCSTVLERIGVPRDAVQRVFDAVLYHRTGEHLSMAT